MIKTQSTTYIGDFLLFSPAPQIGESSTSYSLGDLFKDGKRGFWFEASDISTLFQNSTGTIPVTSDGEPVGLVKDKSGNNLNAYQSTSARRMTYRTSPPRLEMDKIDDVYFIKIPTGGMQGSMTVSTDFGTATYGVSIAEGYHPIGGKHHVGTSITGKVFIEGGFNEEERVKIENYFVNKGGVASFTQAANFNESWKDHSYITSFPLIDTSNATRLSSTWSGCSSLSSFPLINTSRVTNFYYTWFGCSKLTDFPKIDVSSGTRFSYAWSNCKELVNFPENFFDNIKGGDLTRAFTLTNLNQKSIDGILTSLVKSGVASGTRHFDQSGGSAPSSIGEAAIDVLRIRGWTISVTGGY